MTINRSCKSAHARGGSVRDDIVPTQKFEYELNNVNDNPESRTLNKKADGIKLTISASIATQ